MGWCTDSDRRYSTRSVGSINVPSFDGGVQASWKYSSVGTVNLACPHNNRGSNCGVLYLQNDVLDCIGTATNFSGPRSHTKLDNAIWSYLGRSNGVGAAQGLEEVDDCSSANFLAYNYTGVSSLNIVSCSYNSSSNWTMYSQDANDARTMLLIADGTLLVPVVNDTPPYDTAVDYSNTSLLG